MGIPRSGGEAGRHGIRIYAISRNCSKKFLFSCRKAKTFFQKLKGIMFSRQEFPPVLFEFGREAREANAIHSLFCPEFDAVFLDEKKIIVGVIPRIAPFRPAIFPRKPFRYLIELSSGSVRRNGLHEGQKLFW